MNDQDEMFEAATETPAFLGCPAHMPKQLPSGFDGTEPAQKKRGDLEKLNDILFERLGEIKKKCSKVREECIRLAGVDDAEENIKLFGAFSELRQMCDFYKPREKQLDPSAPEVFNPSRLEDIGMQMDRTTVVDDDGVVCKIRRAGVLMMGIGRPAQLWEIDATKHPTYCRVMVFCDHKPIFDGKAFGKNLHRAGLLGLAVMIRFIQIQRKHQRNNRKAAVKKLIKEELA